MQPHYYNKARGLTRALKRYLRRMRAPLTRKYGPERAEAIIARAMGHYPGIIPLIPCYHTPSYDYLVRLCSRMLALKKGMRDEGLGVEEFVLMIINSVRTRADRIPAFLRRLAGWLFLCRPMRWYIGRVGVSVTRNGWPTEVTGGAVGHPYDIRIRTTMCGMLKFVEAAGEGDLRGYCSAIDFAMAEATGVGLKQVSTIDSGACLYELRRGGKAQWPDAIRRVMKKRGMEI